MKQRVVPTTPSIIPGRRRALSVLASIAVGTGLLVASGEAQARKPEDVFKGKIIITKKRLPARFSSASAFIAALKKHKTDKVWPKEQKGNDHAVWKVEYVAFFAKPLNDYEVTVKFHDITGGGRKFIAGDAQMTRDRKTRIFASDIQLAKPEFNVNRRYLMTVESRGRTIARTNFWLRGKAEQYSGTVEFSDEEVSGKKKKE